MPGRIVAVEMVTLQCLGRCECQNCPDLVFGDDTRHAICRWTKRPHSLRSLPKLNSQSDGNESRILKLVIVQGLLFYRSTPSCAGCCNAVRCWEYHCVDRDAHIRSGGRPTIAPTHAREAAVICLKRLCPGAIGLFADLLAAAKLSCHCKPADTSVQIHSFARVGCQSKPITLGPQ